MIAQSEEGYLAECSDTTCVGVPCLPILVNTVIGDMRDISIWE